MDVATITMDEEEARAKLDEYKAGLALRDDEEYSGPPAVARAS